MILAVMLFLSSSSFAGTWEAVKTNLPYSFGGIILDHESVKILPFDFNNEEDYFFVFTWAHIFRDPIKVYDDKRPAAHLVMDVSMVCNKKAKAVSISSEKYRTEDFEVVKANDYRRPNGFGEPRLISDIPGMAEIRDYVCSNRSKWQVVPMNK